MEAGARHSRPACLQADQLGYGQRNHFSPYLANHLGSMREGQWVSRYKMHDSAWIGRRRVRAQASVDRLRQSFGAIHQRDGIAHI